MPYVSSAVTQLCIRIKDRLSYLALEVQLYTDLVFRVHRREGGAWPKVEYYDSIVNYSYRIQEPHERLYLAYHARNGCK